MSRLLPRFSSARSPVTFWIFFLVWLLTRFRNVSYSWGSARATVRLALRIRSVFGSNGTALSPVRKWVFRVHISFFFFTTVEKNIKDWNFKISNIYLTSFFRNRMWFVVNVCVGSFETKRCWKANWSEFQLFSSSFKVKDATFHFRKSPLFFGRIDNSLYSSANARDILKWFF